MCVLKGDVFAVSRDDGFGARRVVVMIGTRTDFEYQTHAVLVTAPPQLRRLTVAVMIDEVTFIEPRKARRPVFTEWLAILDCPRVRVAQVGHRVFDSCGKLKLAGARRNWRQQIKSWQCCQEQGRSSRPNSCCSDDVPQSLDIRLRLCGCGATIVTKSGTGVQGLRRGAEKILQMASILATSTHSPALLA